MSQIAIEIRPPRLEEADALSQVHDEAWQQAYRGIIPAIALEKMIARRGPGRWQEQIRRNRHAHLVLSFGDTLAGYAAIGGARQRIAGNEGEIYELYLKPEYQGVGLGRRLFVAARRTLSQAGRRGLVVWALMDNEPALRFYDALGGKRIATTRETLGNVSLQKQAFIWR